MGAKGVYHINTVDEITQYEHIGTVQAISERFLVPVLEALIDAYPFEIVGFHADNGSEYINHQVAALLNKLHIGQFTKSRARQCNDNALVEGKNGAVIRHYLGYDHIPQRFAALVNAFTQEVLWPYLNYHRPCLFATERRRRQGPHPPPLSRPGRRHALREAEVTARPGPLPQARGELRGARRARPCAKRPRRRP